MLLRCLCSWKRKREDHAVSCANALAKTDSESIEAMARRLRISFASFVARMVEERLLRRATFRSGVSANEGGVSVGGKGYSVGQEKDLMGRLEEDPKEFGLDFEGGARQHRMRVADGSDLSLIHI